MIIIYQRSPVLDLPKHMYFTTLITFFPVKWVSLVNVIKTKGLINYLMNGALSKNNYSILLQKTHPLYTSKSYLTRRTWIENKHISLGLRVFWINKLFSSKFQFKKKQSNFVDRKRIDCVETEVNIRKHIDFTADTKKHYLSIGQVD